MGESIFHPQCCGYKLLLKQFINHDICGGGASGIVIITYNDFVVIALFFLATINRSNIMTNIHRESMMVNGSL